MAGLDLSGSRSRSTSESSVPVLSFFMPGQNARTTENVKSGMSPFIQQGDHILCDFAFRQEHPQHFVPEFLLQCFDIDRRGYGKHAVFMKATVGNKDMQVGVKSHWKITERLYGDNRTGHSL